VSLYSGWKLESQQAGMTGAEGEAAAVVSQMKGPGPEACMYSSLRLRHSVLFCNAGKTKAAMQ
jgi:hypothetical protein